MKEKITVGEFIDRMRGKNLFEIIAFLHVWEETAPIFFGEKYRLEPLTEDFITYFFDEIMIFTHFLLVGFKLENKPPRLFQMLICRMNEAFKRINAVANTTGCAEGINLALLSRSLSSTRQGGVT